VKEAKDDTKDAKAQNMIWKGLQWDAKGPKVWAR
jgi:hypothetical protein